MCLRVAGRRTMYKKANSKGLWHWCKECPLWPENGIVQMSRPEIGGFCTLCETTKRRIETEQVQQRGALRRGEDTRAR